MLSREKLLRPDAKRRVLVVIPEWGGEVYVREFTMEEKEEVAIRSLEIVDSATGNIAHPRKMSGLKSWIVARTVIDSDGKRLFDDGDMELLAEKSSRVIERLADTATELSDANSSVEEAEKKFGSSQSKDSGTS